MDCTALAAKLIEAYNAEHNRLRRARYAKHKVGFNKEFQAELEKHGLGFYRYDYDRHLSRRARDFFVDKDHRESRTAFITKQLKAKAIKQETDLLTWYMKDGQTDFIAKSEQIIADLNKAPVLKELGEKWRKLLDAIVDEKTAYETRWQARCAIKAFNRMDTGILIKFGNNNNGGGSMNRIVAIVIDGYRIPVKKFFDDVLFEEIVLK